MRYRPAFCASFVVAALVASGVAFAQAPANPAETTPPAATAPAAGGEPTAAEQVEKWSRKQWTAAQKKWSKDKAKWADCRKQAKDQTLSGRKSWSFIYSCMTT
jgi:hypothetical protein